jgi:hypothetical protein
MWIKNCRAQVMIYSLMVGLCIIILALALAKPVTDFSTTARNNTTATDLGLNCTDGSIDNYYRGACIVTDLYSPYFIGVLLFIGGAVIISRVIFD